MIENTVQTIEDFERHILKYSAVAFYFSTEHCNVCKILKPKVIDFLHEEYPKVEFRFIDVEKSKEIAAKYSVFTVPTIVFFFEGKEAFRFTRNFGLAELSKAIERPYNMIFS